MSTVRETARITRWASDITARRGRGETITTGELLDYQRAKTALLAEIAERDPSHEAVETLAAARAQLAEMERAGLATLADQEAEELRARAEFGPTSTDGTD